MLPIGSAGGVGGVLIAEVSVSEPLTEIPSLPIYIDIVILLGYVVLSRFVSLATMSVRNPLFG